MGTGAPCRLGWGAGVPGGDEGRRGGGWLPSGAGSTAGVWHCVTGPLPQVPRVSDGPRNGASLGQDGVGEGQARGWPGWLQEAAPKPQSRGPPGPRGQQAGAVPMEASSAWGWPGRPRLLLSSPRLPPGPEWLRAFCGRAAGGRPFMWGCGKVGGQPLTPSPKPGLSRGQQDTLSRMSPPAGVGVGAPVEVLSAKRWPQSPSARKGP